jgi:hypothetical protein
VRRPRGERISANEHQRADDHHLCNDVLVTDDSRSNSPRARWIALVVVCLGQLMSIVDGTIVNVALGGRDGIQRDQ